MASIEPEHSFHSSQDNKSSINKIANAHLDTKLQILTTRKINVEKLKNSYQQEHDGSMSADLLTLVRFMFEEYNKTLQKTEENIPKFKEYEIIGNFKDIDSYNFSLYCAKYTSFFQSRISKALQLNESLEGNANETSYIFVYYRNKTTEEIFTVNCGKRGMKPIEKYADYKFSRKIAYSLLNPNVISRENTRRIAGDVISSQEIFKANHHYYDPSQIAKFYIKFKASLKEDASIFEVPEFCKKNGEVPKNRTQLEILLSGVRIMKELSLESYFKILNHFSNICKSDIDASLKKGFEFASYYEHVPQDLYTELNEQVLKNLEDSLFNPESSHEWQLCHPYVDDYDQAVKYRLSVKINKKWKLIKKWTGDKMTFTELIFTIRNENWCNSISRSRGILKKDIENIRLGFKKYSNWNYKPILKCLSGQLEYNSKTYFKINARWLETSEEFNSIIFKQFKKCMEECILSEDDEGFLPHPWNPKFGHELNTLRKKDMALKLKIKENDVKEFVDNENISFISDKGEVLHEQLEGEILSVPEINQFKCEIQNVLNSSQIIDKQMFEQEISNASLVDIIWDELCKPRSVAETITKKGKEMIRVKNPFFPNSANFTCKFERDQKDVWRSWEKVHLWSFDEGPYNETYLYDVMNIKANSEPYGPNDENGWILGDRIYPGQDKIELFDMLQYTRNKLYLYHVKMGLGQSTRDACSQIVNACALLEKGDNTYENFYNSSIQKTKAESVNNKRKRDDKKENDENYRKKVKTQMSQFEIAEFKKLFDKDSQNKVLVYAFMDSKKDHQVITKQTIEKKIFTQKDFNFTNDSEKIFNELIDLGYLDNNGGQGIKFSDLLSTHGKNNLKFKTKALDKYRIRVWHVLAGVLSHYESLIAKMEILRARKIVQDLGYTFKICQIRRPTIDSDRPPVSLNGHKILIEFLENLGKMEKSS